MLGNLADRWRSRAKQLREFGAADAAARIWEGAAHELETALIAYLDEPLNLSEGAKESGYNPDHLGRRVRRGRLPNSGRHNAPRVRRGDLPFKAGALRARLSPGQTTQTGRAQTARSVVDSHKEQNDG